jgi:hypothetical protein
MLNPPSARLNTLAYSLPSVYVNNVVVVYINGIFRVTFFEQALHNTPEGPEMKETLAPRVSITMTPTTAQAFLNQFGELFSTVAKAVAESPPVATSSSLN